MMFHWVVHSLKSRRSNDNLTQLVGTGIKEIDRTHQPTSSHIVSQRRDSKYKIARLLDRRELRHFHMSNPY